MGLGLGLGFGCPPRLGRLGRPGSRGLGRGTRGLVEAKDVLGVEHLVRGMGRGRGRGRDRDRV